MKLIPYMLFIDYNHNLNLLADKTLPINKIILEKKINFDEINNFWFTQNHYRAEVTINKKNDARIFQIGFKLEGNIKSFEDTTIQFKSHDKGSPLLLSYSQEHNIWFQKSVFHSRRNNKTGYYIPMDYLRGLNHSGEIEVEVYLKGEHVLTERVFFLPSSISVSHYNIMISDLFRIREDLVKNSKVDVTISAQKQMTIDTLENLLSKIEGPIRYINKFPTSNLTLEKKYLKEKFIREFQPEVEIQRQINPGKLRYKASLKTEDFSIRENKLIKQELQKLVDYSTKLKSPKELVGAEKEQIINESKSILQKSSNRIRKKVEKVGIENINTSIIKELITEIKREIRTKHDEILNRKKFLTEQLKENDCHNSQQEHTAIPIILNVKIFAKYYHRDIDYSDGNFTVYIGSGKIPDDRRPSILLKRYQYKKNQWIEPKSIFCDILNSSPNIKEQLLLLKAINEDLGSTEINEDGIDLQIKGFLNPYGPFNRNDIDIVGIAKNNSEYRTYKFHFEKIHSVIVNNREYKLQVDKSEINDQLVTLLLPHDKTVQELQEKIIQLEAEEQTVTKLNQLIKQHTFLEEEDERYNTIAQRASTLLKLTVFKGINDKSLEPLVPTQLFLHDPHYKKIWKSLKDIYEIVGVSLIPYSNNSRIGVNNVNEIFEVWSLLKMISILTEKMGWTISNKKNLIECVDAFLLKRKKLKGFLVNLLLGDFSLEITYEPKILFQGELNSKEPDYRFLFKKLTLWGSMEEIGVVYLDAKYRNYKEQDQINKGELEWKKDISEVAIEKYGNKLHKDNPYIKTLASFILHPDVVLGMEKEIRGENYFAFYNKKLFPGFLEKQNQEEVHKYGSIYFLPTATHAFTNWFKMLMEYRLNMHAICWSCGNLKNVLRETKFTGKGYPKYHYYCQNERCNEYWVKNHCSQKGHKLVKHVNNYHRQKSQDNEWYVVCPTCGDGYQDLYI
ncbi:hypothetical protein ACFY5J_00640 [Peribacillus butanolivorans]|uniref:hypothetical protein n=1 Tax=Peribacillus butanolivorans TaxID=421767 RepID=UPI0036A0C52D